MNTVPEPAVESPARTIDERGMHFGTLDEAHELIGIAQPARTGQVDIHIVMIRLFCGMVEDANRGYWDDDYAHRLWGRVSSPPALLFPWILPLPWNPAHPHRQGPLCVRVPLPRTKLANVRQGAEFFEPLMVGDRLAMVETLTDLSEEKSTRLGRGHFITTRADFTRVGSDARAVATHTNVLFRCLPASAE